MTTTMVRDSLVGDAWIQQTAQANPVSRIIDPATGNPTGDIFTGPVRLGHNDLFELPKPMVAKDGTKSGEPKYGAKILFTPVSDMRIFQEEYWASCSMHWADHFDQGSNQFLGLHSPFRDQQEKVKPGQPTGYTPGCIFFSSTSKFKPPVVDIRNNPVVDRSRVYPGVWAFCALKPYKYGQGWPKRGIAFGIQSVMIIGDDKRLGGAKEADPRKQFAGVNVTAPIVRPDLTSGMAGQGASSGGYMPQAQPGGYNAAILPQVPQAHWTPPASGTAPFVPPNPAPAAGQYTPALSQTGSQYAPPAPSTTKYPSSEEDEDAAMYR